MRHARLPGRLDDLRVRTDAGDQKQRAGPFERGLHRGRIGEVARDGFDPVRERGSSDVPGEPSQRARAERPELPYESTSYVSGGSGHEDHEVFSRRRPLINMPRR